jgi:hypothetical protein
MAEGGGLLTTFFIVVIKGVGAEIALPLLLVPVTINEYVCPGIRFVKMGVALDRGTPGIEGRTTYEYDVAPGEFIFRVILVSVIDVAVRIGVEGYVLKLTIFDGVFPAAFTAVTCILYD